MERLEGCGLHCEELHMLTRGLLLLGVTRVLQDGNQIGDTGAEMIGEGLKVNSSLQWLHLVRLRFDFVLLVVAGVVMERVGRVWAAV